MSCSCSDGQLGAQACNAAGDGYDACQCASLTDAGQPSDAGAESDAGIETDAGMVESVCGNGTVERGETCDDGNTETEACAYGQQSCSVCGSKCQLTAGATSYCGDRRLEKDHGEQCDPPTGPACAYGLTSCQVCSAQCVPVAGVTSVCGDKKTDPQNEDCDGQSYCDTGCGFLGSRYEPNQTIAKATTITLDAQGRYVHIPDMVRGPAKVSGSNFLPDDSDYFAVTVCNGGQITARIEFDNNAGNLDLLIGRMPQNGTPSGPPPVLFDWISRSDTANFEQVTVAAPTPGQLSRIHYVRVEADQDSAKYIQNRYQLTISVTGCP